MQKPLFLLIFCVLFPINNSGADLKDVWMTDYHYVLNLDDNTASLGAGSYSDLSGEIVIPSQFVYEQKSYAVTTIFSLCDLFNVSSITIPKCIKRIYTNGFYNNNYITYLRCSDQDKLIVEDDNPYYDSRNNCNAIIESSTNTLIAGCKNTVIVEGIEHIANGAISGYGKASLIIPNSVKTIGIDAFVGCINLTSLEIGSGLQSIGSGAFLHNEQMTDIYCHTSDVPSGFLGAFGHFSNTTLHVNDYAIEAFKSLNYKENFKEIVVFEKITDFLVTYYVDGEKYKTIPYKYDDEIIPEPEPTKKGMTFSGWSEIPEKMPGKDIDVSGTFSWSKIAKDKILYQVTDTINNCASVVGNDGAIGEVKIATTVELGDNYKITAIANKAFYGCKDVTKIEIPNSVSSIGERAFANIDKMTDVTIYAEDVPETDRTAFENSYVNYVTLHVPYGSLEKYKAVGPWKDFKEIVAIEGTEPPFTEKCNEPTIEYKDGKLFVNCGMEGAECVTSITSEDINTHNGNEIEITATYNISAYAKAEGYNDSEIVTATLCWIEAEDTPTSINDRVEANAVLIQSYNGTLSITGAIEGAFIEVYNMGGSNIASASAKNGTTTIETSLNAGEIALVKIKNKTIKVVVR